MITPFNLPGATTTYDIWDINDIGQLVGSADFSGRAAGYIYDAGLVTTLYGPRGATGAYALGISNNGIVVGDWFSGENSTSQPFVYSMTTGTYTVSSLSLPGSQDLQARSISPDGRYLTGYYTNAAGGMNGFVWDLNGSRLAADIDAGADFLIAQGINSFGQVVGNYRRYDTDVESAFLYDIGTAKRTDFSFTGVDQLSPRGINDQGQIAGWLYRTDSPVVEAWIGNTSGYQIIALSSNANKDTVGEGVNNLGQVVGFISDPATGQYESGFTASPVALPVGSSGGGGSGGDPVAPYVYTFKAAVVADVPIFIDPLVAVGYQYRIGEGNPLFKTVSLPAGIGDNVFDIEVGGQHFTVHGNEIFDFTAHGFADGVVAFTVTGIEPQALLDPANPQAFVTRLTFYGSGEFTGTQTALVVDYTPAVPEPATWGMLFVGLFAVGAAARGRKLQAAQA